MKKIKFNTKQYPFDKLVSDLYDHPLNELNDQKDHTKGDIAMDTDSEWHDKFYDKLRGEWPELMKMYHYFITNEIAPLFVEESELIY